MNLTISPNEKQQAALDKRAAANSQTPQAYLTGQTEWLLTAWAEGDYLASASRLIEAAKNLPQSTLDGIIASIEEAAQNP